MNVLQKIICEISGYEPSGDFSSASDHWYYGDCKDQKEKMEHINEMALERFSTGLTAKETQLIYDFLQNEFSNENDHLQAFNDLDDIAPVSEEQARLIALAAHLECETEELHTSDYESFEFHAQEYRVLTDEEADEAAKDYIRESLWAFRAKFILEHSHMWEAMPTTAIPAIRDMITAIQEKECENCNDAIFAMIKDFNALVSDAISADGRGHFLAGYDHEENESACGNYYIYRTD